MAEDKSLRNWRNGQDVGDLLHTHFENFGRMDWYDIGGEARRVWNVMFNEDIDPGSACDAVFLASCAQASDGAVSAVAAMLGLDRKALNMVLSNWIECQDNLPKPITCQQLVEMHNAAIVADFSLEETEYDKLCKKYVTK